MNYTAILLYKRNTYIENDAFELTFQIFDQQNDLQTDLSAFKFKCMITNNAYSLTKKDVNYTGGSVDEISISADKVTVKIDTDDTNDYDGQYIIEFQLEKIADSTFRQTVYRNELNFCNEELED